jgi:hypothetical protein
MDLLDRFIPARRKALAELLARQKPVVLMGRGHSGTRVLSWICTHLDVNLGTRDDLATGDVSDTRFSDEIIAIAIRSLGITQREQVQPRLADRFRRAVARYYEELGRPTGLWGWKFPETYLIGPCVDAVFPQAQYIHMVRDGRDLAFKNHLTDNPRRRLGRLVLRANNALNVPRHLQAAKSWAYQVDLFDSFRDSLPPDRVFNVTFEHLCAHPEATAEELCQFLKIPMTDACRRYLAEEIDPTKISQHRGLEPVKVREVEAQIGPTLRRYGYIS